MEVQRMFDNLLASIDWNKAAENSYTHFHAKGLSYLNLLRNERLTVKLYTFQNVQHNAQGFLVHPHTHGYNFSHRTMVGSITNHKFAIVGRDDWSLYTFQTPLNGGEGLHKIMPCGLTEGRSEVCEANQSYYLDHKEIHTISVHGQYAAAMLIQYHDVNPGGPTVMFAPHDETPNCSNGLYQRMTASEGRRLVERYDHMLNDGGKDGEDVF